MKGPVALPWHELTNSKHCFPRIVNHEGEKKIPISVFSETNYNCSMFFVSLQSFPLTLHVAFTNSGQHATIHTKCEQKCLGSIVELITKAPSGDFPAKGITVTFLVMSHLGPFWMNDEILVFSPKS